LEIAPEGKAAQAFVEVMKLQKQYDRSGSPDEAVGIGGEIHLLALTMERATNLRTMGPIFGAV
jgi:hypothetical protein